MTKCKHKQLISISNYDLCYNCQSVFKDGKMIVEDKQERNKIDKEGFSN